MNTTMIERIFTPEYFLVMFLAFLAGYVIGAVFSTSKR